MGSNPKLSLSRWFWLAVLLALLVNPVASSDFNPYQVLGVSRRASQAEIKGAYKQLAREWHPDKNKHPDAEEMFIKITKSYEILSNEERRANYDRFGQTDEDQRGGQASQGFRRSHDGFHFNFHSTRNTEDSRHLLHYTQYMSEVVPDSFKKPYLIKVTADWCFTCIHIEPIWREAVQELEALGVGIGVVDMEHQKKLATHLGAHHAPSILGLINGKVAFFHYAVSRENLRQFVESLLPQRLVEKVTDENYLWFLNGWREENKPSVLLFHAGPSVPFLYKLTAFAYREFVRFGYVELGLTETTHILQKFNVNTYAPTMLLFKENTEKPADVVQSRAIKKQIIEEFVSNNRFLLVPRLVNQKLFDELCPVKQFHRRRKYCVLLITGDDDSFVPVNKAFFDFASSNTKEVLRFAYVYQRTQQPLCDTLLRKEDMSPPQVIILERRSSTGRVLYRSVTGGWNGSDEDKHRLYEELELLQRDPAFLTYNAMLPELNNELASIFLVRWANAAYDYLAQAYFDLLYSNWQEMMPILSLIFSALFILFGTIIIQAFSDAGEQKPTKQKAKESKKTRESPPSEEDTNRSSPKKNFLELTELTDETYESNLLRLRPGHINVVLLLNDDSRQLLLRKFAREVFPFSGSHSLNYSFLNVDKHGRWMDALLDSAPAAKHLDEEEDEGTSFRTLDYTGHVLALNGHKKYFCLFRPTKTSTLHLHHKLDQLGLWMERLMEGTLRRYHVADWPDLDAATPKKGR